MTPPTPPRLLVVDDELPQLRALCETLQEQGYDATGLSSAQAALAAMRQSRFDILLADLAMPGMDGIALLREAMLVDEQLVVIIMTGEATVDTAVEAMRSGAYDYVQKPFRMSTLLPVLRRALAMRTLRTQNAELESRLRKHAAELEIANQELEAFTRSASHDLRSPLSGVIGLMTILLAEYGPQLPPQAAKWLRQIDVETHRLARLLDDLLRLSRLGRQALELAPVDLNGLVAGVVEELRQREPERSIEVRVHDLSVAQVDPGLVRQVFVNLLSNAFKYTRGREPAVVDVERRSERGEEVYIVRDNGAGFDMARADKLFHAFQRLHRPEDFEGSGVGLTIVQRIVQRHGGRVWAESAAGSGASFMFTLAATGGTHRP